MDEIDKIRKLAEQLSSPEGQAEMGLVRANYDEAARMVAAQCVIIMESVRHDPYALDRAMEQIRERFID